MYSKSSRRTVVCSEQEGQVVGCTIFFSSLAASLRISRIVVAISSSLLNDDLFVVGSIGCDLREVDVGHVGFSCSILAVQFSECRPDSSLERDAVFVNPIVCVEMSSSVGNDQVESKQIRGLNKYARKMLY